MAAQASEGPRVRVAALIAIAGKVVLARHRAGTNTYHLLPGGGVAYRETLEEALKREVLEETGLEVALGEPLFISDTIDPEGTRHVVNITFEAFATGGKITSCPADARVEAVDLVDPDMLASLDIRPPMTAEIAAVLKSPSLRVGGSTHGEEPVPRLQYLGSLFTDAR